MDQNMDLLMDVQMPVSISFGRARILLKDLLEMDAGSLIPLDRTDDQLVEIQVNRAVIGYGEVVEVDGHYGIRIQKLAKTI
jgi:flagellar motor switch protein FliN/FliY